MLAAETEQNEWLCVWKWLILIRSPLWLKNTESFCFGDLLCFSVNSDIQYDSAQAFHL